MGADQSDMQLKTRFNKGFRFLLCVIDIHSKYAWVIPLKDEKGITINYTFQEMLDELRRKPNKIWLDRGSEFHNRSMKSWLEKKCNIGKIDDIVNKHNNTYHRTIKMKYVDVKWNTYIDSIKKTNNKDPKFKIGDIVRISKCKRAFCKRLHSKWGVFLIEKVKNAVPWTYFINDLSGEEIVGTFFDNALQKTNQEEFRIEKVIKRNGDKLYVKWKWHNNWFNSWID